MSRIVIEWLGSEPLFSFLIAVWVLTCLGILVGGFMLRRKATKFQEEKPFDPVEPVEPRETKFISADALLVQWNEFPTVREKNEWFDSLSQAEQAVLMLALRKQFQIDGYINLRDYV